MVRNVNRIPFTSPTKTIPTAFIITPTKATTFRTTTPIRKKLLLLKRKAFAMKPLISLLSLTILFFSLHPITAHGSAGYDASSTATNDTDFIRTSCLTTLYPDLCYTSLSGYSNTIQQDPARIARIAIGVSLSKASHLAVYVSNLSREADYGADPRVRAAVHDCFSNMGDAVEEIRGSLKQMRQVVAPGSESFRFQMGNVQTWMSAALTDEETCTDGFEDVVDCPTKTAVCGRAEKVKKFTSNALALVNSYAEKGTN